MGCDVNPLRGACGLRQAIWQQSEPQSTRKPQTELSLHISETSLISCENQRLLASLI